MDATKYIKSKKIDLNKLTPKQIIDLMEQYAETKIIYGRPKNNERKEVTKQIKEYLKETKTTITDFSYIIGITRQTLSANLKSNRYADHLIYTLEQKKIIKL